MGFVCVSGGGGGGRPRPRGRSGMVPRIGRWSELMLLRCVETVEVGEKAGSEAKVVRGLWMRSSIRADRSFGSSKADVGRQALACEWD